MQITIGTRESLLALVQSELVKTYIENQCPDAELGTIQIIPQPIHHLAYHFSCRRINAAKKLSLLFFRQRELPYDLLNP